MLRALGLAFVLALALAASPSAFADDDDDEGRDRGKGEGKGAEKARERYEKAREAFEKAREDAEEAREKYEPTLRALEERVAELTRELDEARRAVEESASDPPLVPRASEQPARVEPVDAQSGGLGSSAFAWLAVAVALLGLGGVALARRGAESAAQRAATASAVASPVAAFAVPESASAALAPEHAEGRALAERASPASVGHLVDLAPVLGVGRLLVTGEAGARVVSVAACRTCTEGRSASGCEFERGFIEAGFSAALGRDVRARESKCGAGTGAPCEFEVAA